MAFEQLNASGFSPLEAFAESLVPYEPVVDQDGGSWGIEQPTGSGTINLVSFVASTDADGDGPDWSAYVTLLMNGYLSPGDYPINPATGQPWTWEEIAAITLAADCYAYAMADDNYPAWARARCWELLVMVDFTPAVVAPTVTTQDCTNVEATTATGNGTIEDTGWENCSRRGFCYKVGTSGDPTTADSVAYDDNGFGTGAYFKAITGLAPGTSYRVRAYAVNSAGTGYGDTVQILTKSAVLGSKSAHIASKMAAAGFI